MTSQLFSRVRAWVGRGPRLYDQLSGPPRPDGNGTVTFVTEPQRHRSGTHLEYFAPRNQQVVLVKSIEVGPALRRFGVARRMIEQLAKEYPDRRIRFDDDTTNPWSRRLQRRLAAEGLVEPPKLVERPADETVEPELYHPRGAAPDQPVDPGIYPTGKAWRRVQREWRRNERHRVRKEGGPPRPLPEFLQGRYPEAGKT